MNGNHSGAIGREQKSAENKLRFWKDKHWEDAIKQRRKMAALVVDAYASGASVERIAYVLGQSYEEAEELLMYGIEVWS